MKILQRAPREKYMFEHHVALYVAALPVMYILIGWVALKKAVLTRFGKKPRINAWLFDGLSINGQRIRIGHARWPAMFTVYNYRNPEGLTPLHRLADGFWLGMRNAQAVRNRLKIVKRELHAAIEQMANRGHPIKILSLAAGTAQGVIEEVALCKRRGIPIEVLLIDQDKGALREADTIARNLGVSDIVATRLGNVLAFEQKTEDFSPDIVEMCGLMDYVNDENAVSLVRRIHAKLPEGGFFLTCHIHPNPEALFLKVVIDWKMIYRSIEAFTLILRKGCFAQWHIITEPHGIHSVAVLRK